MWKNYLFSVHIKKFLPTVALVKVSDKPKKRYLLFSTIYLFVA